MGDTMEITTWPKHQNVFYKVTSSAILFDVKASGNAAIGLSKKPWSKCNFWVVLGNNQRCWIKEDDGHSKTAITPNVLSSEEYRRFWVSWSGDGVSLGRDGETSPIITHACTIKDLNYVTFTVIGERNPVHWRFDLPPLLKKTKVRPVTGGEVRWMPADNQLPDGALIGGYEKETLYIIRAPHRGSLTPGKFVPSEGTGYVSWGGSANEKTEFEVLCGFDCHWVSTSEDKIPVGAIEGGYSEGMEHEILYVGRSLYNGHLIPGKVQPSHKVCYIPYDGREIAQKNYEILVIPKKNERCANSIYLNHIYLDSASDTDDEDEDFQMPAEVHERIMWRPL